MKAKKKHHWQMDQAMKQLWLALYDDFQLGRGTILEKAVAAMKVMDIPAFRRSLPSKLPFGISPYKLKQHYQLQSFLDRYIFEHDLMDDKERLEVTLKALFKDQERISQFHSFSTSTYKVVQGARRLIKEILGEYDMEEHMSKCQFGKRASLGNPKKRAYLCAKLLQDPLTTSKDHVPFMLKALECDATLSRTIKKRDFVEVRELRQSFVPKKFDKLRGIIPNTLVGTFYTSGLGALIEDRLKKIGLNISTLPEKHKELARRGSASRTLVTADLSAASDSITVQHIMMLFPQKWARVLKCGRIDNIVYDNGTYKTYTFAGMGNGFTFPLQTLIFYALIRSVSDLLNKKCLVSVFGDDLIYDTRLHRYVSGVFNDLGFRLNPKKTFVKTFFRESCGGDYAMGMDVRPARPEDQSRCLSNIQMQVFLYKIYNGLMLRWEKEEIPITHHTIMRLLAQNRRIHIVPGNFPESSGIRAQSPASHKKEWWLPILHPRYKTGIQSWVFWSIEERTTPHKVISCEPYYWNALREGVEGVSTSPYSLKVPRLKWVTQKHYAYVQRLPIPKWKPGKLVATVPKIDANRLKDTMTRIASWL